MSSCLSGCTLRPFGPSPPSSLSPLTPQVLCPVALTTTYRLMTFKFVSLAWTSLLNSSLVSPTTSKLSPLEITLTPLCSTTLPSPSADLVALPYKTMSDVDIFSPPALSLVQSPPWLVSHLPFALRRFHLPPQPRESCKAGNQMAAGTLTNPSSGPLGGQQRPEASSSLPSN